MQKRSGSFSGISRDRGRERRDRHKRSIGARRARHQSSSTSQIGAVTRTTLSAAVESSGSIAANADVALAFGTSGLVAEVDIEVGSRVKAGDVLAKLNTAKLELQVGQGRSKPISCSRRRTAKRCKRIQKRGNCRAGRT